MDITRHHIRNAGYVIKGLNNLQRLKIISILQSGEMTATNITERLNVGKRETQRHLDHLIAIKVVNKQRKKINLRTYEYRLNSKIYQNYVRCIIKMNS